MRTRSQQSASSTRVGRQLLRASYRKQRRETKAAPAAKAPAAKAKAENPHLASVRAELTRATEPRVRAIEAAQPATVRVERGRDFGSGVCLRGPTPGSYVVLTAGHCAGPRGAESSVTFPDGREFAAVCTALLRRFDLALLSLSASASAALPTASVAGAAPAERDWVCIIGHHARGDWEVSHGRVEESPADPLGDQEELGGLVHSAWTMWGFSGAALLSSQGEVVGVHTSWCPWRCTRHAATWEAVQRLMRTAWSAAGVVWSG